MQTIWPRRLIFVWLALWLTAPLQAAEKAEKKEKAVGSSPQVSEHHLSAKTCGACHKDIYAQWQKSHHSKSSPDDDPIDSYIYLETVGNPHTEGLTYNGEYPTCLQCHAPNAAKERSTNLKQKNFGEGVNCVVCHTLKKYKGEGVGIGAYEISPDRLQGPSGRYLSPENDAAHAFPIEPNQANLRTAAVCLGCHREYKNANGVEMYSTGKEWESMNSPVTCQSCHMPKTDESTDHTIRGGLSETMLTRAVMLGITANRDGDGLKAAVRIENMLLHRFPTGSPLRNAYLRVTVYDAQDNMLWSNFSGQPINEAEDEPAVLKYRLGDAAGKPVVNPFNATQVLKDSRLKPREVREFNYSIPAVKNAALVRVELVYHMLTQEFMAKLEKEAAAKGEELAGGSMNPIVAGIAELRVP